VFFKGLDEKNTKSNYVFAICHKHDAKPLMFTINRPFSNYLKVAEHSFQEPMFNSPLLLSYLCFGARFLQESRLTTEKFILAFWLRCVMLPWQWGWLKTRLKKWFCLFKKNPVVRFFSSFAHYKLTLNPFWQHCSNKILT